MGTMMMKTKQMRDRAAPKVRRVTSVRTPPINMASESSTCIRILSSKTVRPTNGKQSSRKIFHLTPWDLRMLSMDYIQKGILFHKPAEADADDQQLTIISRLLSSFTRALDHFYPLAGRLQTIKHDTSPPSLTIFLDCNNNQLGADFIHASALDVKISDIILEPSLHINNNIIPTFIHSFFPLNRLIGHDGHSSPLLAVQVTELADGLFIGCSLNHAVADGTSFWHFINSWSQLCSSLNYNINSVDDQYQIMISINPPVIVDRWFLDSHPCPISLPFADSNEFIRRPIYPPVSECFLHFSQRSLATLKAMANIDMRVNQISTLQALLAHVWRSVTRARRLDPEQETSYTVIVGTRKLVTPPLPEAYLGNAVFRIPAKAKAGDVIERGLGWVARLLNQEIVLSQNEGEVRQKLAAWTEEPSFVYVDNLKSTHYLGTGSSPRFNVYGNDFGWGRPIAVRSGPGGKVDGKVTVYPGPDAGSMALEICLARHVLLSLLADEEFMEAVTCV